MLLGGYVLYTLRCICPVPKHGILLHSLHNRSHLSSAHCFLSFPQHPAHASPKYSKKRPTGAAITMAMMIPTKLRLHPSCSHICAASRYSCLPFLHFACHIWASPLLSPPMVQSTWPLIRMREHGLTSCDEFTWRGGVGTSTVSPDGVHTCAYIQSAVLR